MHILSQLIFLGNKHAVAYLNLKGGRLPPPPPRRTDDWKMNGKRRGEFPWDKFKRKRKREGNWSMPLRKLPLIMAFNVRENTVFKHELSKSPYRGRSISVARAQRGGGVGRGAIAPPPPNNALSEFCRYIWKFVGTCKPTSMSFVPTKLSEVPTKYWKK